MFAYRVFCLASFAVLTGCAVNPNTGRSQLIAFPTAQTAHADMGFAIAAAAQGMTSPSPCARAHRSEQFASAVVPLCASEAEIAIFTLQVERIGAELAIEVRSYSPGLFTQIGAFHIGVEKGISDGTVSSAGGRIALSSNLAALDPTDDVVAFLIAREMGHIVAHHGEEDSGARMVFTTLSAIVPGGGFIVKFAASMLGSQALTSTWVEAQRREADELALILLERCDRPPSIIALNLRIGLRRERLPTSEWGGFFAQSIERVEAFALSRSNTALLAIAK